MNSYSPKMGHFRIRTPVLLFVVAAITFPVLLWCFMSAGQGKLRSKDMVSTFSDDDPNINGAIVEARSTTAEFISALKSPKFGQRMFSVKVPFTDGKNTEHMWLTNVKFDGQKFHGTLGNAPGTVVGINAGDKISIDREEISDWMFVENGKLVGGFTVRAARNSMSPDERARLERSAPFRID